MLRIIHINRPIQIVYNRCQLCDAMFASNKCRENGCAACRLKTMCLSLMNCSNSIFLGVCLGCKINSGLIKIAA